MPPSQEKQTRDGLVERLRRLSDRVAGRLSVEDRDFLYEAADRIEELEGRLADALDLAERLRGADENLTSEEYHARRDSYRAALDSQREDQTNAN